MWDRTEQHSQEPFLPQTAYLFVAAARNEGRYRNPARIALLLALVQK